MRNGVLLTDRESQCRPKLMRLRLGVPTNPSNTIPDHRTWARHLRSLIARVIQPVPFKGTDLEKRDYIDSFADEYGNRRATDRPFLAFVLNVHVDQHNPPQALDQTLWWMIQSQNFDAAHASSLIAPSDALVVGSDQLAIEYRTMVELCALHALWIIANKSKSDALVDRCLNAAHWHTRELQPDNAINRPWGVAAFIELAHQSADQETRDLANLHAQTLIHNTSVSFGTPDLLSALILKDAADQLDPITQHD